jgi:hypothetical protein
MAQTVTDVGKLRQVLDYWSCETCLDHFSPEQDYLCGICARLNREVVVKRTALGTDEAVQVIPPEDFTMAKDLRDRIQQQELELQSAREQATRSKTREQELEAALARLQGDLARAKKDKEESGLVPFEFVGVKGGKKKPAEPVLEFQEEPEPTEPQPVEWEAVEETVVEEPVAIDEAVAGGETAPQFEAAPSVETIEPGPGKRRSAVADDAIARIEAEIGKIEAELTDLASKEKRTKRPRSRSGSRRPPKRPPQL